MRSALASLFHDRWRIGGVFALGLLLTLIGAALAPKTYTAEAELLLRLGREYIYKPEIGEAVGGAPVAYDREQTLLAEARILTSRDIMETVLDKLGASPRDWPVARSRAAARVSRDCSPRSSPAVDVRSAT